MKKTILLLFILVNFLCGAQSNDEVIFKVRYNPSTKYNFNTEEKTHMQLKYIGSDEFLKNLKAKGIKNPKITNKKTNIVSICTTGKLYDSLNFPLTLEFVEMSSSNGKNEIPDRYLIYGHCPTDKMPTFDSVGSVGQSEEFKKKFIQVAQNLLSQLSFPEKRVKVGDTFALQSPVSIPFAGAALEMSITTHYTLLKIKNGIAIFDISQVYTVKSSTSEYDMKGTGTGKGKLLYDIANNYYSKYQMDIGMALNMKLSNFELDEKTKYESTQTSKISKN